VSPVARGKAWRDGWWRHARPQPSPNAGPRPAGVAVDLAVLHSISLPPGVYGGDAIERLFTNRLDAQSHPSFAGLQGLRVSAHFVVDRGGAAVQYVSIADRAWHAGVSQWRGRAGCNDFSVGIELEGLEGQTFEAPQYDTLARLLRALATQLPLREVVGHEHVAPGRKADPGPGFDWAGLQRRLRWSGARFPAAH